MGFKLRQPIKIDPVARYEVPFTPDNIPDNSGLVARANDNGNMIVNKNIPKNSKLRKVAESHEDNHLRAMMDNKLAYDNDAVYHNMDGKGMKKPLDLSLMKVIEQHRGKHQLTKRAKVWPR